MLRERERQRRAVPPDQFAGDAERHRDGVVGARAQHGELERDELVEGEPPPRALGELLPFREVHGRERVTTERQVELRGERVEHVACVRGERRARQLAQARRRHGVTRGVDRRVVGGRARLAEVVRLDVEAVLAEPAAQTHVRPRHELVGEPRLVEPRRRDRRA